MTYILKNHTWINMSLDKFLKENQLKKRLAHIPYSYEILYSLSDNNPKFIFELEIQLKHRLSEYKYIPLQDFGGMYECFNLQGLFFNK